MFMKYTVVSGTLILVHDQNNCEVGGIFLFNQGWVFRTIPCVFLSTSELCEVGDFMKELKKVFDSEIIKGNK